MQVSPPTLTTTLTLTESLQSTIEMAHPRTVQPIRLFGKLQYMRKSSPVSSINRHSRFASTITSSPSSDSSISLLPPLVLYRRLLRAHRALPIEMRSLGDVYVKVSISDFFDVLHHYLEIITEASLYHIT